MNYDIRNRNGESITREDESQILDTISKWLDRDVRDKVLDLQHADEYPHEMVAQMKALGLFGATISQEYPGMGLPGSTYAKFEECETFSHSALLRRSGPFTLTLQFLLLSAGSQPFLQTSNT
ncbi:MAG: acyl-CoA dehydrogenase family protein [bacterium]